MEFATELALKVLGGKWKATILLILQRHPCRYRDLRRVIPGLSDKVLTDRLKDLQAAGLIARETSAANEYLLTPRGESLQNLLAELCAWGDAHAKAIGIDIDQYQSRHHLRAEELPASCGIELPILSATC